MNKTDWEWNGKKYNTLQEIADDLGLSRQRVHAMIKIGFRSDADRWALGGTPLGSRNSKSRIKLVYFLFNQDDIFSVDDLVEKYSDNYDEISPFTLRQCLFYLKRAKLIETLAHGIYQLA